MQTVNAESRSNSSATIVRLPKAFQFLFQKSRYKAAHGGRGSAKSHSFAQALIIKAAESQLRVLCCREVQRSIRDSVKRLLDDKVQSSGLADFYESTDAGIRGKNGSLFVFAGLRTNIDGIKSLEGVDIAWVEEAQAVGQASLDALIPTVRKENSELWFSWNPNLPTDPVDKMFRSGTPPPSSIVRCVNFEDNPWFSEELRRDMEWDQRRDPAKYAHIWRGEYQQNTEAQVFHNWRVGSEEEFKPETAKAFYYGADWGFAQDPSVLVRCWIEGRTLFVDWEAHAIGCDIDKTPDLFDKIPESRKWPITADSARPETISYMQRHGFPRIASARKGSGSVEEGIEFLKSYDIVIHPRCVHTIDEMTHYSYEVDPLSGMVLPKLADKKNHVIDALRYAVEKIRRPQFELRAL